MAALADDRVSFYTAPIKALVSEKFFDLCEVFGAEDVGMLTGDVAVNPDAPIICCTAEVLANIALREGERADVGLVVMDEFHFYGEPGRGWAWQVPLIELPQAQHLLMSATLGDVTELAADLTRRNGRETAVVDDAVRPVPLTFTWSLTPLEETLEELVTTGQGPVYVVHFTQAEAVEHATSLLDSGLARSRRATARDAIADAPRRTSGSPPASARRCPSCCAGGSASTTPGCCPATAGWSSSSRRRACSPSSAAPTPSGVGINVPIRTVLFSGLAKFDGSASGCCARVSSSRSPVVPAGPASTRSGYVVVQAPEHVIDNEKAKAKAAAKNAAMSEEKRAKRGSKAQLKKPPAGTVVWTEQTFDKLVAGGPEPLKSQMKVDNAMLVNVLSREEDAFPVLRRLLMDNHEDRRTQLRLARRAVRLARSLVALRRARPGSTRSTASAGATC